MLLCYQYKECMVEIFLESLQQGEDEMIIYYAAIDFPDKTTIETEYYPSRQGAYMAAAELIDMEWDETLLPLLASKYPISSLD